MTQTVFGAYYATAYDALYEDKDYVAECDLIEDVFRRFGQGSSQRVLDLGCGTGGHAVRLAERGYSVVGVDRSADMLELARSHSSSARFVQSDIASLDLAETFESVLMMFGVLSYQIANEEVRSALATARRHLSPGGLLFCDVWWGPAVLAQGPSQRVKLVEHADEQVMRLASGTLDTCRDVCIVHYRVWRIASSVVVADTREQHTMRYFFGPELELLLDQAGFSLVRLGAFPDFQSEPSQATWNVALVARAV